MTNLRCLLCAGCLVALFAPDTQAYLAGGPIELSIEVVINFPDGAVLSTCQQEVSDLKTYSNVGWNLMLALSQDKKQKRARDQSNDGMVMCSNNEAERSQWVSELPAGTPVLTASGNITQ